MENEKKKKLQLKFESYETRFENLVKKILKDYLRGFDILDLVRDEGLIFMLQHDLGVRFQAERKNMGEEKFANLLNKVFREVFAELLKEMGNKNTKNDRQV